MCSIQTTYLTLFLHKNLPLVQLNQAFPHFLILQRSDFFFFLKQSAKILAIAYSALFAYLIYWQIRGLQQLLRAGYAARGYIFSYATFKMLIKNIVQRIF